MALIVNSFLYFDLEGMLGETWWCKVVGESRMVEMFKARGKAMMNGGAAIYSSWVLSTLLLSGDVR